MAVDANTQAVPAPPLFERVRVWIRWLKIAGLTLAGLLVLFVTIEAVRLYRFAADIHPALGWLSIAGMAAASLLIAIPAWRFAKVPRAVSPPPNPPLAELTTKHVRAELRFLDRYLRNCALNSEFADKAIEIERARGELTEMAARIGTATLAELDGELERWTASTMGSILRDVDARAERLIYQEALTVGLATAASPNGTLDAFVMLWRSVNLASKIAVLYYGRPGPLGTLAICRDVAIATVSAAYLHNVSDSIGSVLTKAAGGVAGVVAGPAVEGVTNALVLIRIGYVTKERCRSFRSWNQTQQRSAVIKALSATQRVAWGLTSEIFRQLGVGLGTVADAAVSGISQAAEAAKRKLASATGSAMNTAAGFGQKLSSVFTGRRGESPASAEGTPPGGPATERPATAGPEAH